MISERGMLNHNSRDLYIVFVLTSLAGLTILLPVNNILLASAFGLPLIFYLPGYALAAALFPKGRLGLPETLVTSIGFSLAIAIMGGLALNLTYQGLVRSTWTTYLSCITLGGIAGGLIRRRNELPASKESKLGLHFVQVLTLGLSLVVIVCSVLIARESAVQPAASFTQLWVRPIDPTNREIVEIGIQNYELKQMEYKLDILMNDQPASEVASIKLEPGENWVASIQLAAATIGDVQALLYRADAPEQIYRSAVIRNGQ
jgi:uncharacterized membrane protein